MPRIGLIPGPPDLAVELDRSEHVAVIGQRQRRHAGVLGGRSHVGDPVGAVEEAVLAVEMEVDEIGHLTRRF